jgi:hypothetical protein
MIEKKDSDYPYRRMEKNVLFTASVLIFGIGIPFYFLRDCSGIKDDYYQVSRQKIEEPNHLETAVQEEPTLLEKVFSNFNNFIN